MCDEMTRDFLRLVQGLTFEDKSTRIEIRGREEEEEGGEGNDCS